jgi:ion channel POLLUX/CASTOR
MNMIKQRARYWFDNTMSRGIGSLIGWLALAGVASVVVITVTIALIDPRERDGASRGPLLSDLWANIVTTFDLKPADGVSGHAPYIASRVVLSVIYLFVAGALISLLTAGFGRRMEELRRGRSVVLERDHTIVLGWSDQIFTIVSELVAAHANRRKSCIAILADRDKVAMEHDIRVKVGHTRRSRIVCRTGSPMNLNDINLVNPLQARSIIVLSPPDDDADARVVKTLLAVVNDAERLRGEPHHLVATVQDQRNAIAAQLAGGPSAQILKADDIAARLVAQTSRQSGLSVVYSGLLDYEGDELYMTSEPRLTGRAFGEVLHAYRTSSVIGLMRADGEVVLNPPMDTEVSAADQVIAISEDDQTVIMEERAVPILQDAIAPGHDLEFPPEQILILGWNRCARHILRELDSYVSPDSVIHVLSADPDVKKEVEEAVEGCSSIRAECTIGDTTDPRVLQELNITDYSHVIVLCDDQLDAQHADSRTLITLLHLRDMASRLGERIPVVSEMADDRNRDLVPLTESDDFIVSQKLISQLMTQISENRHLADVFAALFSPEGSEIYLRPAQDYIQLEQGVNFYTVVESARRRNEVAIGYRRHDQASHAPAFGVVVNPDKAAPVTFGPGDKVIVLAGQ